MSRILPSDPDPYRRAAEVAAMFAPPPPLPPADVLVCEACTRPTSDIGPILVDGALFLACSRCAGVEQPDHDPDVWRRLMWAPRDGERDV